MTIWAAVLLVSLTVALLMTARILIHYFQLESYQFPGYFRTLRRNFLRSFIPGFILNVVFLTFFILSAILIPEENDWAPAMLTSAAVLGAGFAIRSFALHTKAKKPLVHTARIKRLYAVSAVVILLLLLLFALNGGWRNGNEDTGIFSKICTFLFMTFPVLLPLWIALCGLLAWPIEKGISELYFRDAQRILRNRPDLIKPVSSLFWEPCWKKNTIHWSRRQAITHRWGLQRSSARPLSRGIVFLWRKWEPGMWAISGKCAALFIRKSVF